MSCSPVVSSSNTIPAGPVDRDVGNWIEELSASLILKELVWLRPEVCAPPLTLRLLFVGIFLADKEFLELSIRRCCSVTVDDERNFAKSFLHARKEKNFRNINFERGPSKLD